jgi:Cache domain
MPCHLVRSLLPLAVLAGVLLVPAAAQIPPYGSREEAHAMLDRAIVAVKTDKPRALDMFNNGDGGFKDRDLYPFCANAEDGIITAHPMLKGRQLRDITDKTGYPIGEEMLRLADVEGKIAEIGYMWPRPGLVTPVPKVSFITKVSDQVCGVGYYK